MRGIGLLGEVCSGRAYGNAQIRYTILKFYRLVWQSAATVGNKELRETLAKSLPRLLVLQSYCCYCLICVREKHIAWVHVLLA
jgi:hypothetical protein